MARTLSLASGAAAGAGLMYLLDPVAGRRRRVLMRDQMIRSARKSGAAIDVASRDLMNRVRGLLAETRSHFTDRGREPVLDDVLVARARAKLGRYVRHPRLVEITASRGLVTLRGAVHPDEMNPLIRSVGSLPGVTHIDNQLSAQTDLKDPGGSQPRQPAGEPVEFAKEYWSPAARLLAGALGVPAQSTASSGAESWAG